MKKTLLKAAFALLLLVLQASTVFAFYSDVPTTNPYYSSIQNLYKLGRLPVEDDNKFHPDDQLSKGELYKLIIAYSMAELSTNINLPYIDVSKDSPYAKYIQTALDYKILKNDNDQKTFGVNQKVPKFTVLNTMFSDLGLSGTYFFPKSSFPFTDIDADSNAAAVAYKAFQLNILEKNDPKIFARNKRVTKAEAADYLYKIKQSLNQSFTFTVTAPAPSSTTNTSSGTNSDIVNNKSFSTLADVWTTLRTKYLFKDELSDQKLLFGAIKGMVSQVSDKYTVFQEPSEKANLIDSLSPTYQGVGIVIEMIENKVTIIAPFKDSPAEKAGLEAKDIITKINDKSVEGQTLEEVSIQIKGPAQSVVKLTVLRDGKELSFTVTRNTVSLKRVNSEVMTTPNGKKVGYIALSEFSDGAYEEFDTVAQDLGKKNVDGFIIDLRNNPGGYVDVAVNIISLFTSQKRVALTMKYVDKHSEDFKTTGEGTLKNYKVVVLINKGSASASEIMAGALKDFGIATLVGEKSFGKGIAQELKSYNDGSLFKYTVSDWYTPNGTTINNQGITPDKIVQEGSDANVDDQLNAAKNLF